MNILFILDNYWPFKGGAETLFKNLAEGLVKEGNKATVLTRRIKDTAKHEVLNGVEIYRLDSINRYAYSFTAIPKAISLARNADIIHTTTFSSAFPAWVASKLSGKPAVITVHEVWLGKWKEYTNMNWISALMHNILEFPIYILNFKKYISVSESTKKQLSAYKNKKQIETIYNGVDYSHFNPKKHNGKKIREKLGLKDSFTCLTYGRAAPSKGIEYAAQAARIVKIPNYKHIFIIAKDYSENYKKVENIIRNDKSKKTILLEPIPYSELPDYIAASDCVVVPSIAEGFGYTAAEASAMGKTIVASNTTSLPEVVSGKYVLVQPKNPEAIAEGIQAAHEKNHTKTKLKKFTINKNVKKHIMLYKTILT